MPARCHHGTCCTQNRRQAGAEADRTLFASGRDSPRSVSTNDRRDTPGWPRVSTRPASPLLANILLDNLDTELEQRGLAFVRYADGFVIFTKSRRSAERVFSSITRYLTNHLHLVVNREKSRIVPSSEVEYLGFVFRGSRATINVSDKSIVRFKHRIREITADSRRRWRWGKELLRE